MANVKHNMVLSVTEPNNNIGLIKVRAGDDETQVFEVLVTENGLIKPFDGLTPFFCLMAREITGQGVSEEPVATFDGKNGKLEYTLSANAFQMIGKNEAYFSFRKQSGTQWVEQFSTRSFYYTVEHSIYTQPFKDSNYWFTFKELYQQFLNYQENGKTSWEEFVEQNKEIIENIDPGGKVLTEIILARNGEADLKARLDKEHQEVTAQLAQKANYVVAKNFTGANGGEKIQNALDSVISSAEKHTVVVVDSVGDDVGGVWLLKETLRIPSHTTLLLNGSYLKLDSLVNNVIVTNSDHENGNENIHLLVQGKGVLDCNESTQNYDGVASYLQLGVRFFGVNGLNIKGITIKDSHKQCLVLEKCTNVLVDDIFFDTKGLINQDGIHIVGPSSDIIVNNVRGIVGDDALVVNARSNPPQGSGGGGDVTDVIFNNIIISGGTGNNGRSHVGLMRTAPGTVHKIDNITLSNATGHNLKEAILRLGGNDVAPIENHKNISVSNVKGFEGTSGAIGLAYMRTPVKNLKIDGVTIETTNKKIFENRGFAVEGLEISNVTRIVTNSNTVVESAFEFVNTTIKNVQINSMQDIHEKISTEYLIDLSGSIGENVQVSGIIATNTQKYLKPPASNVFKNIRYNEVVLNTSDAIVYQGITSDKDVVINRYSVETGTGVSDLPERENYQVGDVVQYRKDSTSVFKTYLKNHANEWIRIDTKEKNYGIRITIPTDVTIEGKSFVSIAFPFAQSLNNIFYQLKPSFELPASVVYSHQNYNSGEIRLTLINGSDNPITITGTNWIALATTATFS